MSTKAQVSRALVKASVVRLPKNYEEAAKRLEECTKIDECREWADEAEALAAYARQSEDETLLRNAMRIKGRAIRRCGELLAKIKPAHGANQNIKDGADPKVTRKEAARDAGLSERQQKQALRVAAVPTKQFEAAIESANPPTVTQLAAIGTKKQKPLIDLGGRDPEEFKSSTAALGAIRYFIEMANEHSPEAVVRGAFGTEKVKLRTGAKAAVAWLQKLLSKLEG